MFSSKLGITKGGAAVKVGNRVGLGVEAKAARSVGSMTAVTRGVAVGGGSTIGK